MVYKTFVGLAPLKWINIVEYKNVNHPTQKSVLEGAFLFAYMYAHVCSICMDMYVAKICKCDNAL